MSIISSVLRVKLVLFAVICFVLWEALRTVPSLSSPFTNAQALPAHASPLATGAAVSPVEVAVYYESLCPDSRAFVTQQLVPANDAAAELMNVVLVPYGKAETTASPDGTYSFTCQHGPVECQGNIIHSCAVSLVADKSLLVKYVGCMIANNINPEEIGASCAADLGIAWDPILECSQSTQGPELLKVHGDSTNALNPALTFVPTITLDGSQDNQSSILRNLLSEVCNKFGDPKPEQCTV